MRRRRRAVDNDQSEGVMWRELGLRTALANMPSESPGRAVVEALLARESEREITSRARSPEGSLDRLERLASLRERGHLTDEEFETAKRKLLS